MSDTDQRPLLFPPVPAVTPHAKAPRPLAPSKNHPISDLVVTPDPLAKRIVDYFQPSGTLLDPARGTGPFFRALQRYSNDVRWCEKAAGRDFFNFRDPVDWIITNPPFSKLRQFIQHAITLAPNVVFTGTVQQFMLKARLRDLRAADYGLRLTLFDQPPPPWPSCGFQTAVAYMRRGIGFPFDWLPPEGLPLLQEVRLAQ